MRAKCVQHSRNRKLGPLGSRTTDARGFLNSILAEPSWWMTRHSVFFFRRFPAFRGWWIFGTDACSQIGLPHRSARRRLLVSSSGYWWLAVGVQPVCCPHASVSPRPRSEQWTRAAAQSEPAPDGRGLQQCRSSGSSALVGRRREAGVLAMPWHCIPRPSATETRAKRGAGALVLALRASGPRRWNA
jgi:hypothetical protein